MMWRRGGVREGGWGAVVGELKRKKRGKERHGKKRRTAVRKKEEKVGGEVRRGENLVQNSVPGAKHAIPGPL